MASGTDKGRLTIEQLVAFAERRLLPMSFEKKWAATRGNDNPVYHAFRVVWSQQMSRQTRKHIRSALLWMAFVFISSLLGIIYAKNPAWTLLILVVLFAGSGTECIFKAVQLTRKEPPFPGYRQLVGDFLDDLNELLVIGDLQPDDLNDPKGVQIAATRALRARVLETIKLEESIPREDRELDVKFHQNKSYLLGELRATYFLLERLGLAEGGYEQYFKEVKKQMVGAPA